MVRARAWRPYLFAALAGALYILSFPPYGLAWLGWLALAPLVWALRHCESRRHAFLAGGAMALVACAGGFFWIAGTAHRFWNVPWVAAALLLGLFGTFGEIGFTLFAGAVHLLRRPLSRAPAAAWAALFVVVERGVPKIFPDALGNSAVDVPALPFAAALVGVHGLSFLMAWMGVSLGRCFGVERLSRRKRGVEALLCVATTLALCVYGSRREAALRAADSTTHKLDVALVQSNLGDPEALAETLGSVTLAIDSTVSTYMGLTRRALRGRPADLVVWPETAVPEIPRPHQMARLRVLVEEVGSPLLFGAYDMQEFAPKRHRIFNGAFYMTRAGEIRGRYHKRHLIILGEYVPYSERFPFLLELLPDPGEFTAGPGPEVFHEEGYAFTPLICYELLFPDYVRDCLHAGGEVLVNLTNDYWFGTSGEPEQHLALCRMRAFETGRPIARATNTGISALIDARGRVIARSGVWKQEVLRGTLPVPPMSWTPYARWGDWTTALAMALACAAVALAWKLLP